MFTAHLSVTVKRLTIQAKSSFGRHFGGHTLFFLEYPIIQLDAKIFKLNWFVIVLYLN